MYLTDDVMSGPVSVAPVLGDGTCVEEMYYTRHSPGVVVWTCGWRYKI